jgi:hypothetical protein
MAQSAFQGFYPPKLLPLMVRLLQWAGPLIAMQQHRLRLWVATSDVERLRGLDGTVLLLSNHPTFYDPIPLFLLSGQAGVLLHFLAARELFNDKMRWFFQHVGVYSIRRAMLDRASISQTLSLLEKPETRLVIFPEGGCSFQNDTVMPFREGAIQLAFQALARAAKRGEALPNLYVLPVSLKYRYVDDMTGAIEATLTRLESALGVSEADNRGKKTRSMADRAQDDRSAQWYARLRQVAQSLLVRLERSYELPPQEGWDWNQRIASLRVGVLERCERQLGLVPGATEPFRERTYRIAELLRSRSDRLETGLLEPSVMQSSVMQPSVMQPEAADEGCSKTETETETEAEADMATVWKTLSFDELERSVFRLLNFDAIYDGYVVSHPTQERFLDTLVRLEREVFQIDQPQPKGFREARIKVGEPVNLKDWFGAYQRDRPGTIAALVQRFQQEVQANLNGLL